MTSSFALLTVCGLEELDGHGTGRPTHVLSILDPGLPEPGAFAAWGDHRRTTLHFHDIVEPMPGLVLPEAGDAAAILAFGRSAAADVRQDAHLLIHCHMGISRSTAAMLMILAQEEPEADEDGLTARLHAMREKAWPNARLIGFADEALGRGGRLLRATRRLHGRQLAVRPRLAELMRGLGRGSEVEAAIPP